jgi:hypothetical protein
MKINITTSIDPTIHQSARDHLLAWNDCLEFGILFKTAEIDGFDYPANKLSSKIQKLALRIEELTQEIDKLKNLNIPLENLDIEASEMMEDLEKSVVKEEQV